MFSICYYRNERDSADRTKERGRKKKKDGPKRKRMIEKGKKEGRKDKERKDRI